MAKARGKPRARPPAQVALPSSTPPEPGILLLGIPDGTIVSVRGRVGRIAWKWVWRGDPVATSIRWSTGPSTWSEPEDIGGEVRGEILKDVPRGAAVAGEEVADPLARGLSTEPLFDPAP